MSLAVKFWGGCITIATHLINRTQTPILSRASPYEVIFRKQKISIICEFLDPSIMLRTDLKLKISFKNELENVYYYPYGKKGSGIYDLQSREVFITRDAIFYE